MRKEHPKIEKLMVRKYIGDFIRECRSNQSLTGKQFGELINISQQQVSRYENGETGINLETLSIILYALNTDWDEFYRRVITKFPNEPIPSERNFYPFFNKYS